MIDLFLTFLSIGFFTIGGGYVMIPMIKEKCVEKKNWLTEDEFLDLLAISESTPGPIAINISTYIGYKKYGIKGAIVSTLGVVIPSIVCIYIISLFFQNIFSVEIVNNAFIGIRIGVSIIITKVAINMFIKEYKNSDKKRTVLLIFLVILLAVIISTLIGYPITTVQVIVFIIIFAIVMIKINNI